MAPTPPANMCVSPGTHAARWFEFQLAAYGPDVAHTVYCFVGEFVCEPHVGVAQTVRFGFEGDLSPNSCLFYKDNRANASFPSQLCNAYVHCHEFNMFCVCSLIFTANRS